MHNTECQSELGREEYVIEAEHFFHIVILMLEKFVQNTSYLKMIGMLAFCKDV